MRHVEIIKPNMYYDTILRGMKFIAIFFLCFNINAQDQSGIKDYVEELIPPSPEAFNFSTYGNLPLNGSTGGFNYSVPICTVKSGDITLPISVNYFSNGARVDELAGIVGINWSLNAGGVVSRVIKDYPDELGYRWYPALQDDPLQNPDMVIKIANTKPSQGGTAYDGEQDWFSFNVNGISGSFFFDENLNPHVLSESRVKISYELSGQFTKFTLIDESGFKYIFGGSSNFIESNFLLNQCDDYPNGQYNTSWFLQEIVSPKNNSITFTYANNEIYYLTDLTINTTISGDCQGVYHSSYKGCLSSSYFQSKVLSSIHFKNNSVNFEYDANRIDGGGKKLSVIKVKHNSALINQIEFGYNMVGVRSTPYNSGLDILSEPGLEPDHLKHRLFLKEILFKGNLQTLNNKKYLFEYYEEEQLPMRLSYSKDKFGYNNGSTNSSPFSSELKSYEDLISKVPGSFIGNFSANKAVNTNKVYYGMLKKITYPTGGSTMVEYEANSDTVVTEQNLDNTESMILVKYCDMPDVINSFEFVSNGNPINFEAFADYQGFSCDQAAYFDKYSIKIYKDSQLVFDQYVSYGFELETDKTKQCKSSWSGSYNFEPICTVAGSTYKVSMTLDADSNAVYGNVKIFYNKELSLVSTTKYSGGARVKRIVDYTGGNEYNGRNFYYNKLEEFPSTNTTLRNYYEPILSKSSTVSIWCPILTDPYLKCFQYGEKAITIYQISTNAFNSSYLNRQGSSYYVVTEIFDSNGKKNGALEREFIPSTSSIGRMIKGWQVYGVPPSNNGDMYKDKIRVENLYDVDNDLISKKRYHYTTVEDNYLTATVARKNWVHPADPEYLEDTSQDVCASKPDPLINYSVWVYENHFGVVKLDTIVKTDYMDNGDVENITSYTYGTAPYYLLKSSSTTNSLGEIIKSEFTYPTDLIGVEQTPYMQELVNGNRISEPVITKTFKGNSKLSQKHFKYGQSSSTGNLLIPTEIHFRKGDLDININTDEDRKLQLLNFDSYGNILEYKQEDGLHICYIWGYNQEYPIAKIENATYSQVSGQVSNLQSLSNSDNNRTIDLRDSNGDIYSYSGNEGLLREALNTLRNSLPNAQLTTYTYDPLVGVTSITDAKGYTTYYEYDDFNRLKQVIDVAGHILSENEYNYKQ